jgi:hypothetical protein
MNLLRLLLILVGSLLLSKTFFNKETFISAPIGAPPALTPFRFDSNCPYGNCYAGRYDCNSCMTNNCGWDNSISKIHCLDEKKHPKNYNLGKKLYRKPNYYGYGCAFGDCYGEPFEFK